MSVIHTEEIENLFIDCLYLSGEAIEEKKTVTVYKDFTASISTRKIKDHWNKVLEYLGNLPELFRCVNGCEAEKYTTNYSNKEWLSPSCASMLLSLAAGGGCYTEKDGRITIKTDQWEKRTAKILRAARDKNFSIQFILSSKKDIHELASEMEKSPIKAEMTVISEDGLPPLVAVPSIMTELMHHLRTCNEAKDYLRYRAVSTALIPLISNIIKSNT